MSIAGTRAFKRAGQVVVAFSFIMALSFVMPTGVAHADTEVLTSPTYNPGFETLDGTKNPTGWTKDTFADVGATITATISTTTDAHGGVVAGKVQVTAVTGQIGKAEARWTLSTAIPVTPGQAYTFTDWYKSSTTTSVFIYPNTGSSDWIGDASPQATWTQFHGSYFVPAGVTSIQIAHVITDVGTLTTDDYSLVLGSAATAFPLGMVTLTFDDGWQSFWDIATSTLNANNLKATEYIITGPEGSNVGGTTPSEGYMTKAEIIKLFQSGFDIAAHTRNHLDLAKDNPLTTVPPYATRAAMWTGEINGSMSDLKTLLGATAPVDSFAFPYGSYCAPSLSDCPSTSTQTAGATNVLLPVKNASFLGARSVDQGYNLLSDLSSDNKFKLKMQHVTDKTTVADLQGWINFARDNKVWLIVMFHHVRAGAEASGQLNSACVEDLDGNILTPSTRDADCTTKAVLDGMSAYLAAERNANHVSVKTMHEVLNPADVTAPTIAVTSPANGSTITTATTTVSGTSNDTAVVKVGLNNKFYTTTPTGGTWSFVIPDANALPNGTYTVTASSTDVANNTGNAAAVSFTVALAPVNHAPVADAQDVSVVTNVARSITLTGSDVDAGTTLTFATTTNPAHGSLVLSGATATYTPDTNYTGTDSFNFWVNDGTTNSLATTTSITVADPSCSSGQHPDNHACVADQSSGGGNGGGGNGGGGGGNGGGTVVGLIGTVNGGQVLGASTQVLTDEQIAAILNLLKSFNADQSVIDSVDKALHGQATTGTGSVPTSGFVFTKTLQVGSTGSEVTELQKRLNAEGLYSGPVTGYFGQLTKTAVVKYQAAHNLAQVGIVGPQTRKVLNGQ